MDGVGKGMKAKGALEDTLVNEIKESNKVLESRDGCGNRDG